MPLNENRFQRYERVRFWFSKYTNRMFTTKGRAYGACKNDYQYRDPV